ncbi:MAG TPA: DUF305 domain-containing protein [Longimicrobium sp.]|jgi:uncharacterized protein (DUF305 family)
MHPFRRFRNSIVAPIGVALLAACSSGGDGEQATANASDTTQVAAPAPAAPVGGAMAGMQHGPAKDADQEFLRMMVDHHQGLLQMAQQVMERGSTDEVKAEAQALVRKQEPEQKEMLAILQREYQDNHQPTVMPSNRAMLDSLATKSGADYDMAFRMNVIAHHREGIQMTDQILPRLTRPEVKSMAEASKADQAKDIQQLESKMGHS